MPIATVGGDPGKLMRAKFAGDCAECRGSILPGQEIYHSRLNGDRHRQCVEPGPAPEAAAPRAAPPAEARDAARARELFARDESPASVGWPEGGRREGGTEGRRETAPPRAEEPPRDEYRAPARATEFGRAGDRDAARRELAELIKLQIDFLHGLLRILA